MCAESASPTEAVLPLRMRHCHGTGFHFSFPLTYHHIDELAVVAWLTVASSTRVATVLSVILTGCGTALNSLFRYRRGSIVERLMARQWQGQPASRSTSPAGSREQSA